MTLCAVSYHCPHCGKVHLVSGGLMLAPEAGKAGTVVQLWPGGRYPPTLATLLQDRIWCDAAGVAVAA